MRACPYFVAGHLDIGRRHGILPVQPSVHEIFPVHLAAMPVAC